MKFQLLVNFVVSMLLTFIFVNCSSSDETRVSNSQEVSLAPGTVSAECEVISIEEYENAFSCQLKIINVFRYGSSAPLLQKDQIIKVKLDKTILKNSEVNDNSFKNGFKKTFLLKSYKGGDVDKPSMYVLSIK